MLHITSFVQNIAKLNNSHKPICVNSNPQSVLNGLNRNYSFIYDHNLKRYDYHFENEDDDYDSIREGYWGYLRDRNADRKQIDVKNASNNYDGYWGSFKDSTFEVWNNKDKLESSSVHDDNYMSMGTSVSNSPSILSLSSSINSLSRFRDVDEDDLRASSIFDKYEKKLEYDYNYKTSKLKIQACKRDEMKILMQSLEDQESKFKKEIVKSFDSSRLTIGTDLNSSSNLVYTTKTKQINFLHFSNTSNDGVSSRLPPAIKNNPTDITNRNLTNFKNVFTTLTKLKKSINVFNGDFLNLNRADLFLSFVNNVHASMNDVDGFMFNYLYEKNQCNEAVSQIDLQRQTTNVSLCSNIYETLEAKEKTEPAEKIQKLFGHGNHSTMLFEYQNIKIGFMALIDDVMFEKLNNGIEDKLKNNSMEDKDMSNNMTINPIEYVDYITECDKLSKQLRLCGANIIVVLTNMSDFNEQKLIKEAIDIDIIFSNSQSDATSGNDMKKVQIGKRWIINSGTNFDFISLVSLQLDELNSNKILDISITKYLIE